MSESPSTTRIEISDEETRVVFTDIQSLHRTLRDPCVFERVGKRLDNITEKQRNILTSLYASIDFQNGKVHIATARKFSSTEPAILPDPQNLAYFTTELTEREPTDAEREPYNDAFLDCPAPIYELVLPPLYKFENPLQYDEFTLPIENEMETERIAAEFQTDIESAKWLKTKTSYTGAKTNLPPEWKAEHSTESKETLRGQANQRYHTAIELWEIVFTVQYSEWFAARLSVLGRTERKLNPNEIVALEIVENSENEDFCRYCGQIDDASEIIAIENKIGRTRCVCFGCADAFSEFDEETITKARDEHAKENGGQRVFHNEYES